MGDTVSNFDPAVVVVLYNDSPLPYLFKLNRIPVIIVDNTPERDLNIIGDNITYIPLLKNTGIAHALNIGCEKAWVLGANWILTMDQDSVLPDGIFDRYEMFLNEHHKDVGIICPQLNMYEGENRDLSDGFEVVNEALSSGCLVNMNAYVQAGGFMDKLFIDEVDFEFCRHIRTLGYKIYQLKSVVMQHHLGNTQDVKLFGKHLFYVTHHSYIRHYYMQRNSMYVNVMYRGLLPEVKASFISFYKPLFKILLFEKDKLRKIRARIKGYCDFKHNTFGEFSGL